MPKIKNIQDNIVTIEGKYSYKQDMLFNLSKEAKGYVISATEDSASLLVIGNPSSIAKSKASITASKTSIDNVDVYENYLGSIITPLGDILLSDKKGLGKKLGTGKIDDPSPSLMDRVKLSEPLETGMITIDTMIPIGRGQRELIIGDRSTGKTTIALNTIINQAKSDIITVYVAIGQKRNSVIEFYQTIKKYNAHKNVIVMFSSPDSSSEQFFAPKIGMAMAEVLAYQGKDVLIVLDDLSKHADIYREISLSIGKNPGREAFPTDVFYQHSRLLERSGRFNKKYKNGSITALPIVQTVQGDVASLIPSNIISITDGQIFTSVDMFNKGEFPAIDVGMSVSRTGSAVQSKFIKGISKDLKATYSSLFDVKKFADMSIDISEELKNKVEDWFGINNVLIQFGNKGYSQEEMLILVTLFKMKSMGKIKDRTKFSVAFENYNDKNKGPKELIKRIKKGVYHSDEEKLRKDIKAVYIPLVKIASGIKNDIISEKEYNKLKGDE